MDTKRVASDPPDDVEVPRKRQRVEQGQIECYRMSMRGRVPQRQGWFNILPNRRASGRTDGIPMSCLSPMLLGPVNHGQPGVPPSLTIENYHQGNKVWDVELDAQGNPSAAWRAMRDALYRDPDAKRHKPLADGRQPAKSTKRPPLFSVHLDIHGTERRFQYIDSRYFYCSAYAALASRSAPYQSLVDWFNAGDKLVICGFDGHGMGTNASADELYAYYQDPTHPFGHERVLYAMIALNKTPEAYPWRRYRREHENVYKDMPCPLPG